MNNYMKKLKKIWEHPFFPYLVMASVLFIYHFFIAITFGDDVNYFNKVLDQTSAASFIVDRYHTWSSRVVIETALIYIGHWNVWIWKILNIGNYLLMAYSFSYLFNFKDKRFKNWLIVILVLLYPFMDMSSAGWMATTTNYLWPFALGLYACTAIKKYKDASKIRWHEYILYIFAVLYAANQEQMNVALLGIFSVFIFYFIKHKKSTALLWIMEVIIAAELVFILTCPGNAARKVAEISNWMIEYPMLSFMDKVYLGFTDTMNLFLTPGDYILLIFCSILCFCVFLKTKNWWHRLVSIVPLGVIFVHCYLGISGTHGHLHVLAMAAPPINAGNYFALSNYVPLVMDIAMIGSILLSMLVIYNRTQEMLLNTLVLTLGLTTRVVMGFSPTLYASSNRTCIFLYMALIYCTLYLVYHQEEKFSTTNRSVLFIGAGISLFSVVINVLRELIR